MSDPPDRITATRLLLEIKNLDGADTGARDRLFTAVYEDLRRLARRLMRGRGNSATLRPTALVHEAYLHLIDQEHVSWENSAHFFGIAARAMRQILVDAAREKGALKRGGERTRVTLDESLAIKKEPVFEILDLHNALEKLDALDRRMARVVELRAFAGMELEEVAHILGVSRRTVVEDWRVARMWLKRELAGNAA